MAIFPSAVSTDSDLFIAKNGLGTLLSSSIDNIVTTIPVTSTSGFPTVGYVVIDSEVIKYTSTNATNFLSCTRASDGTSASSHTSGAAVRANAVADHHNILKDEIKAIEQNLSDRIGLGSTQVVVPIGSAGAPSLGIGQINNGLYRGASNTVVVSCGGTATTQFDQTQLYSTVPFMAPTGSAASPSISFSADPNSGFYSGAGDDLYITLGGVGRYTFLAGQMRFPSGLAATPAVSFSSDTSTGLFLNGAGFLGFSANGAMAFQARANGFEMGSGKIAQFDDGTQAAPAIAFSSNSAIGFWKNSANQFSVVMNNVVYTTWSATLGTSIWGTQTSNNAAAGFIGEYIESVVASTTVGTSGQFFDMTSLALTAGDWEVSGVCQYWRNAATFTSTELEIGISFTAGNSSTGLVEGSNWLDTAGVVPTTFTYSSNSIPTYRISLSASNTVYLKGYVSVYTSGSPKYACRISARRVR